MNQTATERRKHFDAIVNKAESHYQQNPDGYKSKLKRLAVLGYGYLFFILLLCLTFLGGLVFLAFKSPVFLLFLVKSKMIIAVALVVYVMLKSLFIKIPSPEGYRLKKSQAPVLFDAIRQLQMKLKTPKIHEILITPELNAAIQQSPRLGIFGWQKNSMILGAELLMVLSQKEVLAVIGHEMGHLSGGHSKFNGWIYRVRIGWMNILYTVAHINTVAKWVFGKFFGWYAPYFNAYSFTLARANEYEADRIAAEVFSAHDLCSALTGVEVMSELFFANYWERLEKLALTDPVLDTSVYTNMQNELCQLKLNDEQVKQQIQKALRIKTTNDNTHPALKDRIDAIGGSASYDFEPKESAAQQCFEGHFNDILNALATSWVEWNEARWKALYNQGKEAKKRLDELSKESDLSINEQVEKAHIQLFLEGQTSALKTFKSIYQQDPNEPSALFYLGTALLERDQKNGLKLLEKILQHADYGQAAGQHMYAYFQAHGMTHEADDVLLKIEANMDEEDRFYEEMSDLNATNEFYEAEFSEEDLKAIKKSLKKYPGIKHLWVAGRKLKSRPDCRVTVLMFELHDGDSEYDVLAEQEHTIEIEGYYCWVNVDNKNLSKHIRPHVIQVY